MVVHEQILLTSSWFKGHSFAHSENIIKVTKHTCSFLKGEFFNSVDVSKKEHFESLVSKRKGKELLG